MFNKKQKAFNQLESLLLEFDNPNNHKDDVLPCRLADTLLQLLGPDSQLYLEVKNTINSREKGGFFPSAERYTYYSEQLIQDRVLLAKRIINATIQYLQYNPLYESPAPIKNIFSSLTNEVLIPTLIALAGGIYAASDLLIHRFSSEETPQHKTEIKHTPPNNQPHTKHIR